MAWSGSIKTSGSLKLFGRELIIPNSSSKPMQNCSNAGQATQGNIAQATSQIPRHGRRGFAVLCKRCRISWKLDIWKDLNRTEFLSLSQNGKVRSKYLWQMHPCKLTCPWQLFSVLRFYFESSGHFDCINEPVFWWSYCSYKKTSVLVDVFIGKGIWS